MTADSAATSGAPEVDIKTIRRACVASAIGNATEWYDYSIFTSGAISLAIGGLFFPGHGNELLNSYGLLAVGFLFRPLGSFIFGPLGDKLGRKRVLSVTILLMAAGTTLVGVLPTYHGAYSFGIGATAIIFFLRVMQGFSTGGEYGGAATFIAEYAPVKRRGFFGSFLEFGTLSGYVLGQIVVLGVTLGLGASEASKFGQLPDALITWGWRIPFFVAFPLGVVGLYLRLRLQDTPTFQALERDGKKAERAPFVETLTKHWRMILNLVGIVILLNVADYLLLTYMPGYFTKDLGYSTTTSSVVIIAVEIGQMLVITFLGRLSDRIGRKPLLLTAAIGFIVLSWPCVQLIQLGNVVTLVIGFAIVAFLLVCILAVIGSTFPAMFPTRVRYGAFSIGYNVSTAIFGGTAGFAVQALIKATGTDNIPAYYLIAAAIIGLVPIILIPETAKVPMEQIEADTEKYTPVA